MKRVKAQYFSFFKRLVVLVSAQLMSLESWMNFYNIDVMSAFSWASVGHRIAAFRV